MDALVQATPLNNNTSVGVNKVFPQFKENFILDLCVDGRFRRRRSNFISQ